NSAAFDWIRLAATRFYAERTRRERPQVRATLDAAFAMISAVVGVVALTVILAGIKLQLSPALASLSVAAAVANALYDYHTALVRARFLDRTYGRLILTKNVLALALTVGGAWWFGSAKFALIGWCLSVAGALASASAALTDPGASPRRASGALMRDYARYGVPIITALVLYQLIPLANRMLTTSLYGFSETGQFSLAFDIGVRLVAAIGSTLDVLLFQIAVQFDETHGSDRARQQVAHNMTVVFAVVLPTCVGCWMVLPSFEALVVPADFRGPFAHYLGLLLPGLCAFALIQYAINPLFQIVKRTMPLIAAALVACAVDAGLILVLPRGNDASSLAIAQAAALIAGSTALLAIAAASRPVWPKLRDVLVTLVSTATMAGLLLPFRSMTPGLGTLSIEIAVGVGVVVAFVMIFDLAGLRQMALSRLRGGAARRRTPRPPEVAADSLSVPRARPPRS
ncbi:MAG: lipopolysaccharide biosynthesis protein, partial [Methylobacteriaceae bacterium]|nr:lipopolysaccharide biosynthesis protein [Methylobacteriaceae bacterium]